MQILHLEMAYWIEAGITVTYLLFTFLCWCVGHIFFRIFSQCNETGFFGCGSGDPIAILTLLIGSIFYFKILISVLLFFVKGELPDSDGIMKNFSGFLQGGSNRDQRRRQQKLEKRN